MGPGILTERVPSEREALSGWSHGYMIAYRVNGSRRCPSCRRTRMEFDRNKGHRPGYRGRIYPSTLNLSLRFLGEPRLINGVPIPHGQRGISQSNALLLSGCPIGREPRFVRASSIGSQQQVGPNSFTRGLGQRKLARGHLRQPSASSHNIPYVGWEFELNSKEDNWTLICPPRSSPQ